MDLVAVNDLNAAVFGRNGANSDLDRAFGVDQAFADGADDEAAMRDGFVIIVPCVLMGIELDEGEGAVFCDMGAEQGSVM